VGRLQPDGQPDYSDLVYQLRNPANLSNCLSIPSWAVKSLFYYQVQVYSLMSVIDDVHNQMRNDYSQKLPTCLSINHRDILNKCEVYLVRVFYWVNWLYNRILANSFNQTLSESEEEFLCCEILSECKIPFCRPPPPKKKMMMPKLDQAIDF